MKKILSLIIVALTLCQYSYAYDFSAVSSSGHTLYYNIVNGNAEVTSQNGSSPYYNTYPTGNLVIPSSVNYYGNTYNVTSIGVAAFQNCSGLTSVTIPNSVTSIDLWAFQYCSGLTSVTIPNSVTSIGVGAFRNCSGLTSVTIPNSVTSIGGNAFEDCSNLTSVTIPNSVTSIGVAAFQNCSGLTSVTIPNSVTSINGYAFSGCCGLTSVTIPNSVTSIGGSAFHNCSGLTTVNFNATNCTTMGSSSYPVFNGCTNLATLNIGENVSQIPNYAFYGCSGLTSVTIPNSVTSIGDYAFYNCSGLAEITSLAIAAPTLENNTFSGISSTIPVYIPCGSLASYQTTWSYFSNIIAPFPNISINVGVTDSTFGVSNVTDGPNCDSTAVIEAVANYGYHFDHWSNGSTANPDTITLTGDSTVTAYFGRNEYQLTLNSADPTLGTVSGSGTYLYLDTAHICAAGNSGYHFVRWNDNNTDSVRTVIVTADITYTACFEANAEIDDIDDAGIIVYAKDYKIHIDEAFGEEVSIYTIDGRTIASLPKATGHFAIPVTNTGVYIVKIGNHPARKVVVIR